MEPYACVVAIDAAGRIQVWANNKVPYTLRSSPTRWGSLKTRSSSTPVASAATSAASRPP